MGLQSKMLEWMGGFEEEAGVMRNAMTTRAPGGANKVLVGIFRVTSIKSTRPGVSLSVI